jgi:hypothetical protein
MGSVFSYARHLWFQLAQRLKDSDQPAFLCLLVICQAATILLTWQLWQVHRKPPMLPALPLPEVSTGIVLLVSLAAIFIRPLPGLIAHTVLVIYSILIDQTRLQPEIVSMVILMWGALRWDSLKTIARTHLISLWFFAGLNKLLSPGYLASISFLVYPRSSSRVLLLPLIEITMGLLALIPRSRKVAAALAFTLHMTIFILLSPLISSTGLAVWFWNLALALAGFALIYPWNESLPSSLQKSNPLATVLAVLILVSPIGFYFGIVDAYLAHNLYSKNIPSAVWYHSSGLVQGIDTRSTLNVPIPPEHRLFESYFSQSCRRGDYLVIHDSRYWAKLRGYELRRLECNR